MSDIKLFQLKNGQATEYHRDKSHGGCKGA